MEGKINFQDEIYKGLSNDGSNYSFLIF